MRIAADYLFAVGFKTVQNIATEREELLDFFKEMGEFPYVLTISPKDLYNRLVILKSKSF